MNSANRIQVYQVIGIILTVSALSGGCRPTSVTVVNTDPYKYMWPAEGLYRDGQYAAAETDYRRVLSIDPRIVQARSHLASCLEHQHKFKDAAAEYANSIFFLRLVNPRPRAMAFAQEDYGRALVESGDFVNGKVQLESAISECPPQEACGTLIKRAKSLLSGGHIR